MWSFSTYKPKELRIPDAAMSAIRTGLEARFSSRFTKFEGTSDGSIAAADNARTVADNYRTALSVIEAQKENAAELFQLAQLMVQTIDDFQRQTGAKQVNNVPLPGPSIKESDSKKLSYAALIMKFLSAGLLHFMEQNLELISDNKTKDRIIESIAAEQAPVPLIGRMQELDLDNLISDTPIIDTKTQLDISDDIDDELPMRPVTPAVKPAAAPLSPPHSDNGSPAKKDERKIAPPAAPAKAVKPVQKNTPKK